MSNSVLEIIILIYKVLESILFVYLLRALEQVLHFLLALLSMNVSIKSRNVIPRVTTHIITAL